ncbi:MAG: monovalent cation/H(+) antiporter subunit G [Anaplasmataceae bacterium]|nr:monovalent cation/H(+) antiporter subunit G [Candidatus Heimdallarchaeota archaeon]MDH5796056.1 monovalent cation/H(+) antiporter subunit G [Anaplasmataceae bacterium]
MTYLSYIAIILGLIVAFIGILGIIRFEPKDNGYYIILHSAGMIDTLSSLLVLVGIGINAPSIQIAAKLLILMLLLWFNSVLSSYIMVNYHNKF